ncbi:MAG: thiol-activated cytolysin family protein [Lachnoclostridium sp.]|nr:thiol-activated cytolysin family protein [Lachnospira sp.]MCM1249513.1 thiol-activated cytolysin family protein [Lachnoclostridium sp.]MCM1534896.1 thiol-activated cytolysin family protein [Clostridium sp.]
MDNNNQEEEALRQEIQKIYEEQLALEQQIKNASSAEAQLNTQYWKALRQKKKLEKSKARTYGICLFAICLMCAVSFWGFFGQWDYIKEERTQAAQKYAAEYRLWKTDKLSSYFNKCKEEMRNARFPADARLSRENREEMNSYIASLDRVEKGIKEESFGSMVRLTDTQIYEMKGGYTILDSGNTVIFPGAVVKGDSLFRGTADYTLLPLDRTSMYLTSNQAGGGSAEIENVSYQGTMAFLDDCAGRNEGKPAKQWDYVMEVYRSSEELKAGLGIQTLGIGIDFEKTSQEETSCAAVIYRQTHYTVSAEPKKSAAEYFKDGADMTALGDYEPAYISSVDYGRVVVVLVFGNISAEELSAKLSNKIGGVISADLVSIGTVCKDLNLTSHLYQYGGEQKDVGIITDTSSQKLGIGKWWDELWNGSGDKDSIESRINDFVCTDAPASNSVPIKYTLKYLADNSFVPAMFVTDKKTLVAERDSVKRVKITTDERVDWKQSEMESTSISMKKTEGIYEYEFLWNSDSSGMMQGHMEFKRDNADCTGEARLNLADCPMYEKNDLILCEAECSKKNFLSGHTTYTVSVNAGVMILDY